MDKGDLSSLLGALSSDPAVMKNVMGALSSLSRGGEEDGGGSNAGGTQTAVSLPDENTSALSAKSSTADRRRLIAALKPYLSEERRSKAEALLNIMGLLDSGILDMLHKGE